jgi:hypothetical protein
MPLRMLGCALLLMVFVAVRPSMTSQTEQDQEERATEPRWEYKVVRVDQYRCASEQALVAALNTIGQKGWELVRYERLLPFFPKDADGTLLIRPAATGVGKLNNPQTADSFQGTMTLKMGTVQQPECRVLFKRQANAKAKP